MPEPAETTLPTPSGQESSATESESSGDRATLELSLPIGGEGLSLESTALTMGDLFGPPPLASPLDVHGLHTPIPVSRTLAD